MAFSLSGLGSGLDTASLVQSLMQAERIPATKIQSRQQAALKQVTAWNDLRTKMQAVQTAAEALQTPPKALGSTATTSDDKSVKATATAGASPGQYSLQIHQLATAQQQVKGGLGPLAMTVGAGRSYLTAGTLKLDLSAAPAGVQNVEVTRSSAAAAVYGTPLGTLPAGSTDLTVAVDGGAAVTLTLNGDYRDASGAVDPAKLVTHVNDQLTANGVSARAAHVGGRLQIATSQEGSTRTLQLGGAAAGALGLSTTAAKGSSALVTVNGKSHEVEPTATAGMLALGTSGVSLEVGPAVRTGSTKANVVVTTDTTTLADLQTMLNATGSPASAAVVAGTDGTNSLVLSSTATGTQGMLQVTAGTPVLAGLSQTTAAVDAKVTLNGIAVTRSSNTLTEILPGLSLTLLAKPSDTADRTVTVSRDSAGTTDKAKNLVDSLNLFLSKVASDTKYDVRTRAGGPLVGDNAARSLGATLFSKAASVVGTPSLGSLSALGIEATRDGRFQLKSDVLSKALAADPDSVAKVLSEFADSIAVHAKRSTETGGLMTGRRDGAQSDADARQKQLDAMEVRLARVEKRYKAQYAALETSMAALNSQRSAMGAALSSFMGPPS